MLLERLPLENFGEQVRGILVGRDVLHLNDAGAPHLAQLEELAVDVARVLRARVLVAQLVGALVVGLHYHVTLADVADELEEGDDVDHFNGALRERDELRLGGSRLSLRGRRKDRFQEVAGWGDPREQGEGSPVPPWRALVGGNP